MIYKRFQTLLRLIWFNQIPMLPLKSAQSLQIDSLINSILNDFELRVAMILLKSKKG
jgi:hypothetical protein